MENAEIHICFGMQQIFTSLAIALEFEDCLLLMPDRLHSCCTDYLCARCSEGSVVVSTFACNAAGRGSLPGPGACKNLALYIRDCVSLSVLTTSMG